MEGLKLSEAELMIYIHPSKSRNVFQAICRELSSLLFQFVLFFYFLLWDQVSIFRL